MGGVQPKNGSRAGLWADATRGELRLLAHAIRAGWAVPAERRGPIMDEIGEIFLQEYIPSQARRSIAAAWVFLRADEHNMEVELLRKIVRS